VTLGESEVRPEEVQKLDYQNDRLEASCIARIRRESVVYVRRDGNRTGSDLKEHLLHHYGEHIACLLPAEADPVEVHVGVTNFESEVCSEFGMDEHMEVSTLQIPTRNEASPFEKCQNVPEPSIFERKLLHEGVDIHSVQNEPLRGSVQGHPKRVDNLRPSL
jgi:hypothetical protein